MPLFKKKPVTIEARQTPANRDEYKAAIHDIIQWVANDSDWDREVYIKRWSGNMVIDTLEGEMEVPPGWWVIRGIKGEFYPCDPSVFEDSYDFVGPREYRDAPYMVN